MGRGVKGKEVDKEGGTVGCVEGAEKENFCLELAVEGDSNGHDSVLASKGNERGDAACFIGTEKEAVLGAANGWDAVEREREEMRKLKLKHKHSPGNRMVMRKRCLQDTPRIERTLLEESDAVGTKHGVTQNVVLKMEKGHAVEDDARGWSQSKEWRDAKRTRKSDNKLSLFRHDNCYRTEETEEGETCDVVPKIEMKHVVEDDTNGWGNVESRSKKHRYLSKRGTKIAKKLLLSELDGKDKNMNSWNEGLRDMEGAAIQKNVDGQGNERRDAVCCMAIEKEVVVEEEAAGFMGEKAPFTVAPSHNDPVGREKEEIRKLKLKHKHSPGSKMAMQEHCLLDTEKGDFIHEAHAGFENGETSSEVAKMEKHVVDDDANGWGNMESRSKVHRYVSNRGRKAVKELLPSELKGKEENINSCVKGLKDVEKMVTEKNGYGDEINCNVRPWPDAFLLGTVKRVSDGDGGTIFFDFDSYKSSLHVREGELWAMYDEHGMPRRYAKILGNGHCYSAKVRFLRFYNTDVKQWYKESGALRVCGTFIPCSLASSWASHCDSTAFSHKLLSWREEDTWVYEIYPRKGEIWAVTTGCNSTPFHVGSPTIQRYHIVEVLEDYNVHTGTKVGHLTKVKGSYRSLFQRCINEEGDPCLCIPPTDVERFSHQIPFFHITGEATLSGCIELDPASLPLHTAGLMGSLEHGIDEGHLTLGLLDLKISWQQVEFRHGAVWAVYDDSTRMPQKYVAIEYFYEPNPESRIKMTLLKPCHITEEERKWSDSGLTMACGNFIMDETFDIDSKLIYSHPVRFELEPKPHEYDSYVYKIYPQKGDVWGIYRNLKLGRSWNPSRFGELQYEIAEIVGERTTGKGIEARKLVRIEGFKCLFRREKRTFVVPSDKLYTFSHQIPAYKFEEHTDGCLKGSIILDPLLVPEMEREYFTFKDSSVLETLKLQPLHVVLQYLMGKEITMLENKEVKCQQSEYIDLEDSCRKEVMDVGIAEMGDTCEQQQCRKLEESKKKIVARSLCHQSSMPSITAAPKASLVKPRTVHPEEQPLNLRSSVHIEELRSNSRNLKHLKPSQNLYRMDGMEGGVAEMNSFGQLQCRRLDSKTTEKTKEVKPKTVWQDQPFDLRISVQIEKQPTSRCSNVCHDPEGHPRRVNASNAEWLLSKSKAEKVQSELDPGLPSFIKPMKPSHVSGGFWLGLPSKFCQFLPGHDCTVVLIDEDRQEFETVYLAKRTGLSGGWRGFSLAHQLAPGDALVFQLVHPARLKVYIIRVTNSGTSDGMQQSQNQL